MVYLFSSDAKVLTVGLPSSWLAIFECRRISAVTLLGILKCRRVSADRGWLFISANAKVQKLALSLLILTMPIFAPLTPPINSEIERLHQARPNLTKIKQPC